MKRFVVISLALFLILPLLFVPCFASSVYTFVYYESNDERDLYTCLGVVPEGVYDLEIYFDGTMVGSSVSPFTLTYNRSGDLYEFSILVPVSIMGELGELPLSGGYFTYEREVSFLRLQSSDGAEQFSFRFVPVSSDVSVLDGFGAVASAVIDWVGQIAAAIVDHPFLLVTVGIFFVGGCIALFSRFLSRD